jgi:hypothetical protein
MEPNAAPFVNLAPHTLEVVPRPLSRPAPGYRTTEFYLTVALIVVQLLFALGGLIPPEHAAVYATITGALYKVLRTALKAWAGHLDLQAELASVAAGIPPLVSVTPADCAHSSVTATEDGGRCNSCGADMTFDRAKGVWVKVALMLLALFLVGCAETRVNSRNGKTLLKTHANADSLAYAFDGGGEHITLQIVKLNHSDATLAGGQAFKLGADSVGTSVVSGILSGGLPWAKATAAGLQIIPQIAAPVILQSKH